MLLIRLLQDVTHHWQVDDISPIDATARSSTSTYLKTRCRRQRSKLRSSSPRPSTSQICVGSAGDLLGDADLPLGDETVLSSSFTPLRGLVNAGYSPSSSLSAQLVFAVLPPGEVSSDECD
jgi:hypothetical protein